MFSNTLVRWKYEQVENRISRTLNLSFSMHLLGGEKKRIGNFKGNVWRSFVYPTSATTSFTSGIMRFIIPSIPAFKVIIDEGQPEQLP